MKSLGNGHSLQRQSATILFRYRAVRRSPVPLRTWRPGGKERHAPGQWPAWKKPALEFWSDSEGGPILSFSHHPAQPTCYSQAALSGTRLNSCYTWLPTDLEEILR